ncbi:MAG: zinc ribbon domain-containing protein [Acidobacteriota bacterium]
MICPRCGAENQPSAKICRMCATPLEAAGQPVVAPAKGNAYPPTGVPAVGMRDGKAVNPPVGPNPGPGETLCPTCKAVNDATWAYCQQCGSQLHKMMPQSVAAPVPVPVPPVQKPPLASVPAPAPIRPPVAVPIPPAPPVQAAPATSPAANSVNARKPEDGASASKVVTCISCGRINTPGSSFCATCGAPLPVDQTLMMAASASARVTPPKLRLIQEGGGDGEIYKLDSDETVIGRNSGDIRFPHDGYMSGRHARIIRRGERFVLVDENSRNGTFKRIDGEVELKAGDIILIGKQLFRFEL